MTYFNPLSGSNFQSQQVQRTLSADKDRQSRQSNEQGKRKKKDGEHEHEDGFVPSGESAEAEGAMQDEASRQQQQRKPEEDTAGGPPHLDLRA